MSSQTDSAKLLIVDDIAENLLSLEALLKSPDREIHKALSGDEALELLLRHEFAMAIIDVQMPVMDGFALAEYMRCTERTKNIPIVFVSAGSKERNYAFKGYESGAVDFLYKPLDSHTVKSKVNVFIDLYRHRKALKQQVNALENSRREQEELLAVLRRTQQELEQAVRMRDDFMSIVSHELRTPLNTLKLEGYIRRMHLEEGDAEAFSLDNMARMLETDERQVQLLIRLIDDMLDVSRIRTGKLSLRPARVDLFELVKNAVAQFAQQLAAAGCPAQVRGNSVLGTWDEFRIEQVIANLLTNAMRYGAGKAIEIDVGAEEGAALLRVRDYGIGIGADDCERIFRQFERAADGGGGGGLGLGLYIADQIVGAHGGSIGVRSALGEGAEFTVLLPCDSVEPAA